MANPFVHVELQTQDPGKAKGFYKGLFNWELEDAPGMEYTMVKVGEGVGGGIMKSPMPGIPAHWLSYVLVDDVATSTAKAKSLGGKVVVDKTEVPGMGWFSVIQDPTGAALGLWQSKAQQP